MQVFITNENLAISAKELDDVRLNKQITEINQILLTYINSVFNMKSKIGHKNHPVNIHYRSNEGIHFLIKYNTFLCDEYRSRFLKYHMGYFTINSIREYINNYDGRLLEEDNSKFKPAYIKGRKNVNQIHDEINCYELYRQLLIKKWDDDNINHAPPKWTRRSTPDFYKKRKGE